MSWFIEWVKNPARGRLLRVRDSLAAGQPLDPSDRDFLIRALTEIEARWPKAPKKPAEELGRLFAQAFGALARPGRPRFDQRTGRQEQRRIALAREMVEQMQAGDTYDAAREKIAAAHGVSESSIDRAYRDHKQTVALNQAAREFLYSTVAKLSVK